MLVYKKINDFLFISVLIWKPGIRVALWDLLLQQVEAASYIPHGAHGQAQNGQVNNMFLDRA